MKFSTREDIEATIKQVFDAVSDFDALERVAMRRGADVTRLDDLSSAGPGMQWEATFPFRNRERVANMELTCLDAPNKLVVRSNVSDIAAVINVELLALARRRTRLSMSIDMRPETIPARVLLQSMKMARKNLLQTYRERIAKFAQSVEKRSKT